VRRKTKEQREAAAKAALRQRIEDIALGAEGGAGVLGPHDWFAGADCLGRLLPALKARFGLDEKGEELERIAYLWSNGNLHYYDNVDSITEFFWNAGVRA
jgi:hypothetical protein